MKISFLLLALNLAVLSTSSAVLYSGNGNTGFGGVVSSMDVTNDATNITFKLNRGPGQLNDQLVIYIDSVTGGSNSTTNFTDASDNLRRAISGRSGSGGVSVVTFPTGFTADYGIALEGGFAGVWGLVNNGTHTFLTTANGAPGGSAQSSYTMTTSLASLGLSIGTNLRFVATYLNAGTAFRSDEGIGTLPSGNPGTNPATFTSSSLYTVVPEPSTTLLGALFGLAAILRRRR